MTTAFLYKWTQVSTGKWYIGSRTANGCHPSDGYICSSKIVKPMILENINDWHRDILVISNSAYIAKLERKYLILLDARNDTNSYNRNNCTPISKSGPRPRMLGINNHFYGKHHSTGARQKIKKYRAKQVFSDERNNKISKTLMGRVVSSEVREKISKSVKLLPKQLCIYCGKSFLPAHFGRFHGNKCKLNIIKAIL